MTGSSLQRRARGSQPNDLRLGFRPRPVKVEGGAWVSLGSVCSGPDGERLRKKSVESLCIEAVQTLMVADRAGYFAISPLPPLGEHRHAFLTLWNQRARPMVPTGGAGMLI